MTSVGSLSAGAPRESRRFFLAALVLPACLIAAASAAAAPYTWQNAAGGDWTFDGNWDIAGEPSGTDDTATIGDLSGPYTVTLGTARTIGGLTLSGSDPTLALNSILTISGGNSQINGSLLAGSGTLRITGSAAIDWTGPMAAGPLTIEVPWGGLNSPTINNAPGSFNIASNQVFQMVGSDGNGTPRTTTFSNGFTNDGLILLGNDPPGDWHADQRLAVTDGTLVNSASGHILMNPRQANNFGGAWNNRSIFASVQNDGLVTVRTPAGRLGDTGKTVVNNGTITLDSSIIAGGTQDARAGLTIVGNSFTNTGTVNVNDGLLSMVTPTFSFGGSYNIDGGTLAFGGNGVNTVIDWNIADFTNPYTFRVNPNAQVTLNRSTPWLIQSDQRLEFATGGGSNQTALTVDQDVFNSGTVWFGMPQPGDNFLNHRMTVNSTNSRFTNEADGKLFMFPRSASSLTEPWSVRRLEAELVNHGEVQVLTHRGFLGKAGANHENHGLLLLNDAILGPTAQTPTLNVTGNSFTNAAGGTLAGNGILNLGGITLDNAGALSPGMSTGILTVQGDVNFLAGGSLLIDVAGGGGVAGTDYDRLVVAGNVTNLSLADLVVDFGDVTLEDIEGSVLTILTSTTDFTALAFNSVTMLNGVDFNLFDVNYLDGMVTLSNFQFFVPEPGTLLLLAGFGTFALGMRPRRRKARGG